MWFIAVFVTKLTKLPWGSSGTLHEQIFEISSESEIAVDMPLVESVWVEIVPFCNKKYILVGYIYKHPGANMDELKGKFNKTTLISI